jgi:hypothetical protein
VAIIYGFGGTRFRLMRFCKIMYTIKYCVGLIIRLYNNIVLIIVVII